MKPLSAIAAGLLIASLFVSPLVVYATGTDSAGDSVTISAITPTSVSGTQTFTVSGTVTSGTGSLSGSGVTITITNPSGTPLGYQVLAPSGTGATGTFTSSPFSAGSPASSWPTSGAYTAKAQYGPACTGSCTTAAADTKTFSYTATATTTTATSNQLIATVTSTHGTFFAGQTAYIYVLLAFGNGTLANSKASFTTAQYWAPGATTATALGAATPLTTGLYAFTVSTTGFSDGIYGVQVTATCACGTAGATATAQGIGAFGINSLVANSPTQTVQNGYLTSILSDLGTFATGTTVASQLSASASNQAKLLARLATLQTDLKGNFTAVATAITAAQTAITGAITSSQTAITSAITSATSGLATASSISTLSSAVSTGFSGISTTLSGVATASSISALGTTVSNAVTQATNAANNSSTTSTYVLVVAVLVAITLVLELAVLVRKLS